MKEIIQNKKIYFIYTILFVLISIIVFAIFLKNGCTFIWQGDGLKQHYIILKDFNEHIRNFIKNPQDGLQLFSWNMGLGMDVIGQYSYYIIGDFFAYISLLFPMENLEIAYTFLILLRMFFIGISFIYYGRYHKHKGKNILLGAIIYTFSAFSLFAGVRHPYFLNAMILFPMLLLGVDKLLEENKKVHLCIWTAISAISNYYFFYMHTIMIVIYAIIKYFCEYRKEGLKFFFKKFFSGVISYALGILTASIILFPTIYAFLNSARTGEENICQYTIQYYQTLFSINLLTAYGENWSYIGVSSIILLILPVLWTRRKQNKTYFIYWLISSIFLVIPFCGSMMNGFSFPNNRWSFIYGFILAYCITICFDEKYTRKELRNICFFIIVYSMVSIVSILIMSSKSCFVIYLIQILLAFCMLVTMIYQGNINKKENLSNSKNLIVLNKMKNIKQILNNNIGTLIIYILVICNIGIMAYGLYSSYDRNYACEFIPVEKSEQNIETQLGKNEDYSKNIKNILSNDKSFYRIAKVPHHIQNLSIYYGYPSTECFLSIGNKYVYNLNYELADCNFSTTSCTRGFGDRSRITTLLGTKYYIIDEKNKNSLPYGYILKEKNGQVKTYENQNPLSIGVSYFEYMLKNKYDKLNPLQKEDAITKVAVIEEKDLHKIKNDFELQSKEEGNINEKQQEINIKQKTDIHDIEKSCISVPYKIIDEDNILGENEIKTTKKNQKLILSFDNIDNAELYVFIDDFEFQGTKKHTISAKFGDKSISKTIENKITSAYFQKCSELLLPLGYYEKADGKIELTFSTKGIYKLESIQILAVPMNDYKQNVEKLQLNELKNVSFNNNQIKGIVNLSQNSILQISTGYTDGWKVYVDEEKVETIKVNTAFIGIPVIKGEHEIKLQYEVPYLKQGIICSLIGVIGIIVLIINDIRFMKKNKDYKNV